MEDKITSKSINSIKDFIANTAYKSPYLEICGFVGFDKEQQEYIAQVEKNTAQDPKNFFSISPVRYLNFKSDNQIVGIFHSHVIGDENPSEFDIKMSESSCVPFIIFSLNSKKFCFYEPQNKEYDVNIVERFKKKLL